MILSTILLLTCLVMGTVGKGLGFSLPSWSDQSSELNSSESVSASSSGVGWWVTRLCLDLPTDGRITHHSASNAACAIELSWVDGWVTRLLLSWLLSDFPIFVAGALPLFLLVISFTDLALLMVRVACLLLSGVKLAAGASWPSSLCCVSLTYNKDGGHYLMLLLPYLLT